jgi:hypothetical protein
LLSFDKAQQKTQIPVRSTGLYLVFSGPDVPWGTLAARSPHPSHKVTRTMQPRHFMSQPYMPFAPRPATLRQANEGATP